MRFRTAAAMLGVALAVQPAFSQLTEQQRRGKAIYTHGANAAGGEIKAAVGADSTEMSASLFACASCHNYDGTGKPEGGVTPSNITWDVLTRPFTGTEASGRKRGPYTERLLGRAIAMGLDASGDRLSEVMPRFHLSHDELAELIDYMKSLGTLPDPGLTADAIRVGLLLPSSEDNHAGQAVAGVLQAYLDGVNRQGGIYGRRIELVSFRPPTDPADLERAAASFLSDKAVFALISGFLTGIERPITELTERESIPLIGPLTALPQVTTAGPHVFYLDGGLNSEVDVLAKFATGKPALLIASALAGTAIAERFRRQAGEHAVVEEIAPSDVDGKDAAERVLRSGLRAVLVVAPGALAANVLQRLARSADPPECLIPGSMLPPEIFDVPASLDGHLFASFVFLPADVTAESRSEYESLAQTHRLETQNLPDQFRALAAAHIFTEGLRRAGRDLSRDKLIETLEQLYEFPTGFTQPVTFGPGRRVGGAGAHVMRVDLGTKKLVPVAMHGAAE